MARYFPITSIQKTPSKNDEIYVCDKRGQRIDEIFPIKCESGRCCLPGSIMQYVTASLELISSSCAVGDEMALEITATLNGTTITFNIQPLTTKDMKSKFNLYRKGNYVFLEL